jgi:MOSC domain-containing protein YiiM
LAKVISVNLSPQKGSPKYAVNESNFIKNFGMEGDGHAGNWHRQVSLFDISSMNSMSTIKRAACEKSFSENITTQGIELHTLDIGTKIEIGETIFKITQIGKEFVKDSSLHTPREIIMHVEGIFCIVLKTGKVKVGDGVRVV